MSKRFALTNKLQPRQRMLLSVKNTVRNISEIIYILSPLCVLVDGGRNEYQTYSEIRN